MIRHQVHVDPVAGHGQGWVPNAYISNGGLHEEEEDGPGLRIRHQSKLIVFNILNVSAIFDYYYLTQ